jgi:hypothetical protein
MRLFAMPASPLRPSRQLPFVNQSRAIEAACVDAPPGTPTMRLFIAALFAIASIFAVPAAAFATSDVAVACGPDAPAAWLVPGGYCDQIKSNNSLSGPNAGPDCPVTTVAELGKANSRIRVAAPIISPCCPTVGSLEVQKVPGGRVQVAVADPCDPCPIIYRQSPKSWKGLRLQIAC